MMTLDERLKMVYSVNSKEAAEAKIAAIKTEQNSKMHRFTKTVTKFVAGVAMQSVTIDGIYAVGNGISEGLTGESLHGVGLVATTVVAAGVGLGVGLRTCAAVDDALTMVDEWRLKNAEDELQAFTTNDEEFDDAVDSE